MNVPLTIYCNHNIFIKAKLNIYDLIWSLNNDFVVDVSNVVLIFFLVFTDYPFVIDQVLVVVSVRFEFEGTFVVFVNFGENQLCFWLPVIPASNHEHFLGPRDLLCFIAESMGFDFESWWTLKYIFEFPYDFPLWLPMVLVFVVKKLYFLAPISICFSVFGKLLDFLLNFYPINVNLVLQSIEFVIPSSSYIFFFHNTFKSIFS